MAIYGYTKNYKLIKPKYDTDTWHDYEYDNLDTIDSVLSAIYASGNWKGFWKSNTHYVVGDVVIDRDTDTMYRVMVEHTTSEATFAAEQTAHPDYYELWSPNNLAESWATKTDGKVAYTDYSAKAYAVSSGLTEEGSAKEWAINSGAIGNTGEYSAKKYATDAHNDYISMTTNPNVAAVGSNINNVNAVGQSISSVNTVAGNVSSVNTVAGVSTDVTSVASMASSVPTVANNDANITTVATNISDVNTAATNIAAIQDAPNQAISAQNSATQASQSATSAAQSATTSAASASNSHIWAEGTDAQVQALGGVHSSKGWAQQSTNANIALTNSPYTTNRILEIPQDIKLELNNGMLTLKAGSKVYVPNGPGVFNEVVISSDITADTSSYSGMYVLAFINGNPTSLTIITNPVSGDTAPTSPVSLQGWYDTTNNLVKRYNIDWQTQIYSFPIAICTSDGTNITSIDQVFNGFGYIGSTVFVLPGVKVQTPNGRNEDGTYKSILKTIESVLKEDTFNSNSKALLVLVDDVLVIRKCSVNANNDIWFDEKTGYMVRKDGNDSQKRSVIIADILSSTKISSFTPYNIDSVLNSSLSNLSAAGQAKFDAKANVSLNNLDTAGQAILNGKANANASNFTAAGKETVVGWGMPGYFSKPRVNLTSGVWNHADKNIQVTILCNKDLQGYIYINKIASDTNQAIASACVSPATGGISSCQALIRKGIYYKAVFNNIAWYDELMEG